MRRNFSWKSPFKSSVRTLSQGFLPVRDLFQASLCDLVEKRSAAVRQNFVLVLVVVPVLEKAVWSDVESILWTGVGRLSHRDRVIDRGRDDCIKIAPPSEPDRRFSRIRLSSR